MALPTENRLSQTITRLSAKSRTTKTVRQSVKQDYIILATESWRFSETKSLLHQSSVWISGRSLSITPNYSTSGSSRRCNRMLKEMALWTTAAVGTSWDAIMGCSNQHRNRKQPWLWQGTLFYGAFLSLTQPTISDATVDQASVVCCHIVITLFYRFHSSSDLQQLEGAMDSYSLSHSDIFMNLSILQLHVFNSEPIHIHQVLEQIQLDWLSGSCNFH